MIKGRGRGGGEERSTKKCIGKDSTRLDISTERRTDTHRQTYSGQTKPQPLKIFYLKSQFQTRTRLSNCNNYWDLLYRIILILTVSALISLRLIYNVSTCRLLIHAGCHCWPWLITVYRCYTALLDTFSLDKSFSPVTPDRSIVQGNSLFRVSSPTVILFG